MCGGRRLVLFHTRRRYNVFHEKYEYISCCLCTLSHITVNYNYSFSVAIILGWALSSQQTRGSVLVSGMCGSELVIWSNWHRHIMYEFRSTIHATCTNKHAHSCRLTDQNTTKVLSHRFTLSSDGHILITPSMRFIFRSQISRFHLGTLNWIFYSATKTKLVDICIPLIFITMYFQC